MALVANLGVGEHLLVTVGGKRRMSMACWWLLVGRIAAGGCWQQQHP